MTRRWVKPFVQQPLPSIEGTLFEGAFLDDLANELGSSDLAHKELGVRSREVQSEGVSVELSTAALALDNIMTTYNQLNRTMGARTQAEEREGSDFTARYNVDGAHEGPEKIIERMGYKATRMLMANENDFAALHKTKELIEAGFSTSDAEIAARIAKASLLTTYGPGVAYAKDRAALVQRIKNIPRNAK